MNKIILNDTELELQNFYRNTYTGEVLNSTASISIAPGVENLRALYDLLETPINSLIIKHDDEIIYECDDIDASIVSINESLMDNAIQVNINIAFQ